MKPQRDTGPVAASYEICLLTPASRSAISKPDRSQLCCNRGFFVYSEVPDFYENVV